MTGDVEHWVRLLEAEWSKPEGFLGKAREGVFDAQKAADFIGILNLIRSEQSGPTINRRLVALVWYVPIFLHWQRERIAEQRGDLKGYEQLTNQVHGLVEEILGVP